MFLTFFCKSLYVKNITSTFVTRFDAPMLETLITSKTRLRILVKLFINAANNGYLRGLADELNESTNAIRKELNNLTEAGYLEKEAVRNTILYKANTRHPLFSTLQKIVRQHLGLDAIIEMILSRMGTVYQIALVGDYANGIDSGFIQVQVYGADLNAAYIEQLQPKIEAQIKRKVFFELRDEPLQEGLIIYENQEF